MNIKEAISELDAIEMEFKQIVDSGIIPKRDDFIFMMNRRIDILSTICKLLVAEKEVKNV